MSLLSQSPSFSCTEAESIAASRYGVEAIASPLPSERDQNFLLHTISGERFILKISNSLEDRSFLEAQNEAMKRAADLTSLCQVVLPSTAKQEIEHIKTDEDQEHLVRMVTYLPGIPLADIKRHSPALLQTLGSTVGAVDNALAGFDHPAAHRDFHWDLANALKVTETCMPLISDRDLPGTINQLVQRFEVVTPRIEGLPRSIIHNDANDYNVLVGGGSDLYSRNQSVVGLIDFGDLVYSYTVADLAITLAYAMLDKQDILDAAAHVVRGYNRARPLSETAVAVVFDMACMRLCVSACLAAKQQRQRPEDPYLSISQEPISRALPRLAQIHPRFAEATFRSVCGMEPSPASTRIVHWLRDQRDAIAPVVEDLSVEGNYTPFDLSISSPLIAGSERDDAEPALTSRLFGKMAMQGTSAGIGRYDEPRWVYTAPQFAGIFGMEEARTIHLGLDIFVQPGSPVYAPLDGEVAFAGEIDRPQDYGPLIILKHKTDDSQFFYTLYGHLSRKSLDETEVGRHIGCGERLGYIGKPEENGGWSPHLHLQLITDLLELDETFPGVAPAGQRQIWKIFSPNPATLAGIPEDEAIWDDPSSVDTLADRKQLIGGNVSISYRTPVKIVRGYMQYLYDHTGRKYIDAYNNVPHVGHCHPRVVEAARAQIGVLNTNTRYLNDLLTAYAARLTDLLPDPLNVCYLVNSGSEANELAIRLARTYTNENDVVVLEAAYHGHTNMLIDLSPYKHDGPGGKGSPPWVHTAPLPDTYRGLHKAHDPQAGPRYAEYVKTIVEKTRANGAGVAAYLAESVPSVGGQIVFPDNYLPAVYKAVRAAGGLCIADEIQTGFGRLGTHFWGFEQQNVIPDIVCLGKPIGNGHPIGAVITTREITGAFDNGMEFFSTFGGNNVSCAIGLAVLDVLEDEDLQTHALHIGRQLLEGLEDLKQRYPLIGDVRGSGLFLGAELVRDRGTLEPAADEASFVANRMRDYGILMGTDGPLHNVLKIRPPMPFSADDGDRFISTLGRILHEDFAS